MQAMPKRPGGADRTVPASTFPRSQSSTLADAALPRRARHALERLLVDVRAEMGQQLPQLLQDTELMLARTAPELAERLFRDAGETLADHPAFPVLEAVRDSPLVNVANVRKRYMESLSKLLRSRASKLSESELRVATIVVLQILRCEIAMEASPETQNRRKVLSELQVVLANYLSDKVDAVA